MAQVFARKIGGDGLIDMFTFNYISSLRGTTEQNSAILMTEIRLHEGVDSFQIPVDQVGTVNNYLEARSSDRGGSKRAKIVEVDRYKQNSKGVWGYSHTEQTAMVAETEP
jgi:hypothetical protein